MSDQEFVRQTLDRESRERQEHADRVRAALEHAKHKGVDSRNTSSSLSNCTNNPRSIVGYRGKYSQN